MRTIALVSPCGGVGRTSLAANLATSLALARIPVITVELDPENQLALHLGANARPSDGIGSQLAKAAGFEAVAQQNSDGVTFLPFGQCLPGGMSGDAGVAGLDPDFLAGFLERIDYPAHSACIIDTPRYPSVFAEAAIRAADHVLVLLPIEGRALFAAGELLAAAEHWERSWSCMLVKVDLGRGVQRDICNLLCRRLAGHLIDPVIHCDETFDIAFSQQRSVFSQAPHSLAAHEIHALAAHFCLRLKIAA